MGRADWTALRCLKNNNRRKDHERVDEFRKTVMGFSGCGLEINGSVKIGPTEAHAKYFTDNVKTYTTFPPLFKNEKTRWGDSWDDINYPTPEPIFKDEDINKYPVVKKEADGYTWICYVELE